MGFRRPTNGSSCRCRSRARRTDFSVTGRGSRSRGEVLCPSGEAKPLGSETLLDGAHGDGSAGDHVAAPLIRKIGPEGRLDMCWLSVIQDFPAASASLAQIMAGTLVTALARRVRVLWLDIRIIKTERQALSTQARDCRRFAEPARVARHGSWDSLRGPIPSPRLRFKGESRSHEPQRPVSMTYSAQQLHSLRLQRAQR
jgi:hypothetical protein